MNRETSVYLDLVRFLCATEVFLAHASGYRFAGGLLWQTQPVSEQAVDVFFVLSGFVIAYVADLRERTVESYMVSRAARLYSVVLPAIVLTIVLDAVGYDLRPDLYLLGRAYSPEPLHLLAATFFLNEAWAHMIPGSNVALWSLSYEVAYYTAFGFAWFATGRTRILGLLAVLLVGGPAIALMSPMWLLGFLCYHAQKRFVLPASLGFLLFVGAPAIWLAWMMRVGFQPDMPTAPMRPFLDLGSLAKDYAIGLLFGAHLIGFRSISPWLRPLLQAVASPIQWIAGATFSLYVFHMPLLHFLAAISPWQLSSWPNRIFVMCGTLAAAFLLAEVTERRKDVWRRLISGIWEVAYQQRDQQRDERLAGWRAGPLHGGRVAAGGVGPNLR